MESRIWISIYLIAFLGELSSALSFELQSNGLLLQCGTSTSKNHTAHDIAHTVKHCRHKIRISLTVKNKEKSPEELQYAYVKDVLEVESGNRLRLLNPILVRFRQEQVLLGYPIKYLTAVNGKASEKIINYENQKNFTGCDDTSTVNPTCGLSHQKGVVVEYSQGFCCYCPDVAANAKQARGGQDCSLAESPSKSINLVDYKASAHCLVKDKLWFTVNALDEPIILHQIFIQVYNLRHLTNGSSVWVALTGDEDMAVGPHNPFQYGNNKTLAITYVTSKPLDSAITIPYKKIRLLVPQPLLNVAEDDFPPVSKNGPGDYILVPKENIDSSGDTCNKAGVSYEGFFEQSKRCDSPKNSCLGNQPLDFWEKDNVLMKGGGKGKYLLKFFGMPYKDPIVINKETSEHWLALEYHNPHKDFIYIEADAKDIVSLTIGKHGIILTAITESTLELITFHLIIQNSGLASAEYAIKVTDCEYSVPDSNSESVVIAPQLNSQFTVKTKPGIIQLSEKFTCMVEVRSTLYKVIAKREVTVKPKERCICNFHCSCVCLNEPLSCDPLTEDSYHLAGFRGSLPVLTAKPPYKMWIIKYPVQALLAFIFTLLLLGFVKASFGLLDFSFIGEYGLQSALYKPEKIARYPDPVLEEAEVVYDDQGYPLDPDTKERLKLYNAKLLFTLNCFFFFVWPFLKCIEKLEETRKNEALHKDVAGNESSEAERLSGDNNYKHFSIDGEDIGSSVADDSAVIEITGTSGTPASTELEEEEEEEEDPDNPSKFRKKVSKLNKII